MTRMLKQSTNVFNISKRKVLWGMLGALFLYVQAMIYQLSWWPLVVQLSGAGHDFLAIHPLLSPVLFITLYTMANICCLPVNTILRVLSGMLFGHVGIIYALTASVLGASMNYSMGRYLLSPLQFNTHQEKIRRVHHTLQQRPIMSLLVLRSIPVFPAWLVSMAAGYLHYHTTTFILISLAGFIPACCLYVYVGATGQQLLTLSPPPAISVIICCAIISALIIRYITYRKIGK